MSRRAPVLVLAILALAGATGVARAQGTTGSLHVAWNPNVTDLDLAGYRVYVDDDPNTFTLAPSAARLQAFRTVDVNTSVTDQVLTGLDPNKVWIFAVTSLDLSGNESGFSNTASAQPSRTPVVRTVTPSMTTQGTTGVSVTITGDNFDPNSVVTFGAGIAVIGLNTAGAPTSLVVTINVDPDAQAKAYTVSVTNPGGSTGTRASAFTVTVRVGRADIDASGRIDGADFLSILLGFPSVVGDAHYNINIDMDADGKVDGADLAIFFSFFGMVGPFP